MRASDVRAPKPAVAAPAPTATGAADGASSKGDVREEPAAAAGERTTHVIENPDTFYFALLVVPYFSLLYRKSSGF